LLVEEDERKVAEPKKKEDFGTRFERLFAEICGKRFLKGFVFHSPKIYDPTEQEIGDVVLWVRRYVVNFELVSQNHELSNTTKNFVRRIGLKRKQHIRDFAVFHDPTIEIQFHNGLSQRVIFDKTEIPDCSYLGVVLVDCGIPIEKMHFDSFAKSLEPEFPLAIMTLDGFRDLLEEVDTVPDLVYYLSDRHKFVKSVFPRTPGLFLDLNRSTEKNLVSFYKLNENQFQSRQWHEAEFDSYPAKYGQKWSRQIEARNLENQATQAIDDITDYLQKMGGQQAKLHSWELAMLSRRQRASGVGQRVYDALVQLPKGKKKRWFAYYNQATGCWSVFYFRYGGTVEEFRDELETLTRQKLIVEINARNFEYSVFGYGFRKSPMVTGTSMDDVWLTIADAHNEDRPLNKDDLSEAQKCFHGGNRQRIKEFPEL